MPRLLVPPEPNQMSLEIFSGGHVPSILKKPVEAIHVAMIGGNQNRTQRLAFNLFLQHAHHEGMEIETYKMPKQQLIQLMDYTSRNIAHLKKTLSSMMTLQVVWDVFPAAKNGDEANTKWEASVMVQHVGFDRDNVYFQFNNNVKGLMFDPDKYANLDLNIQKRLTLDVSFVLYEWAARYRNIKKTRAMSWQKWRDVLYGDEENATSLLDYKEFKRRKLIPAIRELNELTDLQVQLVENRSGTKAVRDLQFLISEKPRFLLASDDEQRRSQFDMKMAEWGMSATERENVFKGTQMDDIEANIIYVTERLKNPKTKPVTDIPGFLKSCIKSGTVAKNARTRAFPAGSTSKKDSTQDTDASVIQIQKKYHEWRTTQAAQMFEEMEVEATDELIKRYNAESEKAFHVPSDLRGRTPRLMVPFYGWLAHTTWGEPSVSEVLKFALQK